MAEIISVGIDIGTSTTQIVFSRLTMENTSGYFSVPNVSIVDKEIIYKSSVHTTPLHTDTLIDGDSVQAIVAMEYERAGYTPADIDTGAVIITGESARKKNASLVMEKLSGFAGDFVVSSAGPDLEAIIAGKGSGAYQYSLENGCVVANLDIGGGTTNVVLFGSGEVLAKGCVDIGGRLIQVSQDLVVKKLSPAAAEVAKSAGINIVLGKKTTLNDLSHIANVMVCLLEQLMGMAEVTPLLKTVKTPGSSDFLISEPVSRICFSGGVADCIYNTGANPINYGDIGVLLGKSVRESRLFKTLPVIEARETICATVIGAGIYTTTISGSTITYTNESFPIKNIPVLRLTEQEQAAIFRGDTSLLEGRALWFISQNNSDKMALAIPGKRDPGYKELQNAAHCIAQVLDRVLMPHAPLVIVVECDIAKALGQSIHSYLHDKRSIICIDNIKLEQNDYLDLGKPLMNGLVIPAVVKTLVFG